MEAVLQLVKYDQHRASTPPSERPDRSGAENYISSFCLTIEKNPQIKLFTLIIESFILLKWQHLKVMDEREFVNKIYKIIWQILQENKAWFHQVGIQTSAVARFAMVPCFTNP